MAETVKTQKWQNFGHNPKVTNGICSGTILNWSILIQNLGAQGLEYDSQLPDLIKCINSQELLEDASIGVIHPNYETDFCEPRWKNARLSLTRGIKIDLNTNNIIDLFKGISQHMLYDVAFGHAHNVGFYRRDNILFVFDPNIALYTYYPDPDTFDLTKQWENLATYAAKHYFKNMPHFNTGKYTMDWNRGGISVNSTGQVVLPNPAQAVQTMGTKTVNVNYDANKQFCNDLYDGVKKAVKRYEDRGKGFRGFFTNPSNQSIAAHKYLNQLLEKKPKGDIALVEAVNYFLGKSSAKDNPSLAGYSQLKDKSTFRDYLEEAYKQSETLLGISLSN